jgi:CIC family chloride channel protein
MRNLSQWVVSERSDLIWAAAIGAAAGGIAAALKGSVAGIRAGFAWAVESAGYDWLVGLGPLLGLITCAWAIRTLCAGEHPGPGIPATLHAIGKRRGRMKRLWIYSPLLTSALTVGFGGSGGLEAPALQSGAALGAEAARATRRTFRRRLLFIGCAASASLAAMFKAPVAAIVFAVEVIMLDLTAASLVPLLVASVSALLVAWFLVPGTELLAVPELPGFTLSELPWFILLGGVAGAASIGFAQLYLLSNKLIRKGLAKRVRIPIAGLLVGAAVVAFPGLYGEGYGAVNALFSGDFQREWAVLLGLAGMWVLKPVLTGVTVGAGGVAGIFAPALYGGAVLGACFAGATALASGTEVLPVGSAVLAGLAGMLAGILHAPLTAIFLATELSGGYGLFVPVMLTSAAAFVVAKRGMPHSIYTRELAERGELLTHDKDSSVLTLMSLREEVERDFLPVHPEATLGELTDVIARSRRNLHPVVSPDGRLVGIVDLQDVREVMFDRDRYADVCVRDLMAFPAQTVDVSDHMEDVMAAFEASGAWNLPVLENGRYLGFVSRSRLFNAYRKWLREVSGEEDPAPGST